MEKPLFPMTNVSISQRAYSSGSHKTLQAIDINGENTGIENGRAPCMVKVLKVLEKSKTGFNNTVLVGTCDIGGNKASVLCADGIKRVLTFAFTHDNYIGDIKVGSILNQWDVFYQEGTTGQATGNHIHLEVGIGWQFNKYKDANGNWCIRNLISPEKVFWLDERHTIKNRGLNGYTFKYINETETEDNTLQFKLIKGSFLQGKKYATRPTAKGKYSINYPLVVGDIVTIDNMVADKKYWIGHIKSGPQANRWVELDPGYFEVVA